MKVVKARAAKIVLPLVALVVFAWWRYPKDLDLSHVTSSSIKNEKGQPAQLWWWRPKSSPVAVFKDNPKHKGTELYTGNEYGEWYSVFASEWMIDKWLKVAYIGARPDRNAKVYLFSPPEMGRERFFLAPPSELTKVRPLWSLPREDDTE